MLVSFSEGPRPRQKMASSSAILVKTEETTSKVKKLQLHGDPTARTARHAYGNENTENTSALTAAQPLHRQHETHCLDLNCEPFLMISFLSIKCWDRPLDFCMHLG